MICRCCIYNVVIIKAFCIGCICKSEFSGSVHCYRSCNQASRCFIKLLSCIRIFVMYCNASRILSLVVISYSLLSALESSHCICRCRINKLIITEICRLFRCHIWKSKLSTSVKLFSLWRSFSCRCVKLCCSSNFIVMYCDFSRILSSVVVCNFLYSCSEITACICRCRSCQLKVCYIVFSACSCIRKAKLSASVKFFSLW